MATGGAGHGNGMATGGGAHGNGMASDRAGMPTAWHRCRAVAVPARTVAVPLPCPPFPLPCPPCCHARPGREIVSFRACGRADGAQFWILGRFRPKTSLPTPFPFPFLDWEVFPFPFGDRQVFFSPVRGFATSLGEFSCEFPGEFSCEFSCELSC